MTIAEALFALGVREDTLSDAERNQLDSQGFLHLKGILSMQQVEAMRQRLAELLAEEGDKAGLEVHQEAGTDRLSDLINKDEIFDIALTHPKTLAAIAHVLQGDLKLSSLNSRNAQPGKGRQGLHADWGRLETPGDFQVCNSFWLLDELTTENGAPRVVPGTHNATQLPGDVMSDTTASHPNELILTGAVGDVVVVNSHLWHGGTCNQTEAPRRMLHGYFTRRHQPQQLDQQKYLRKTTYDRLSEAARVVLGITHSPD